MGGLALAAYGVAETRESYAPDRKGIVGTTRAWSNARWKTVRWLVQTKVLRRAPVTQVITATGIGSMSMTGSAHAQIGYGAIDPSTTSDDKLAVLDERTRAIRADVNRLDTDARADRDRLDRLEASFETTKTELRDEVQSNVRRLATGGLSREATGLALTAVGTLVAAFG
jgi:hypothetical protein